jgi:ribosomal protein L11 methyltransferase
MPSNTGGSGPDREGPSSEDIRREVLSLIDGRRRSPSEITKELARGSPEHKKRIRDALRELVAAGELAYTCEHGRTFLEPSFDRPVRVSGRVVLTPPGRAFNPGPDDVVVRIGAGASFGAGRHPTTRLALRGIEFALGILPPHPGRTILDIGTGTGVLAIAAVKLGIERGLGIDIDPCAVSEANQNLRLNGLTNRIEIADRAIESIAGVYTLVAANLRSPSLAQLASKIAALTEPHGALVISGLRREEQDGVLAAYRDWSLESVWESSEDEWAGVVLRRRKSEG